MEKRIESIKLSFLAKKTERDYIQADITKLDTKLKKVNRSLSRKEKALLFVEEVAIATQKEMSGTIEECVAAGLNSVFDTVYGFKADFKINRGRPECPTYFVKDDRLVDPLAFSGLGAADVAGFAARVSCLAFSKNQRKVLILDEPFQRLKGENENKRVIDLMRSLSHKLGIQIICVNDERAAREDIIKGADKVFHITQKGDKSQIEIL